LTPIVFYVAPSVFTGGIFFDEILNFFLFLLERLLLSLRTYFGGLPVTAAADVSRVGIEWIIDHLINAED
jgi:hypothetical protein